MNLNELYDTLRVENTSENEWERALRPYVNEGRKLVNDPFDSRTFIRLTSKVDLHCYTDTHNAYLTHKDDPTYKRYYTLKDFTAIHRD